MLETIAAQPIRNMLSFAEREVYKRFCTNSHLLSTVSSDLAHTYSAIMMTLI